MEAEPNTRVPKITRETTQGAEILVTVQRMIDQRNDWIAVWNDKHTTGDVCNTDTEQRLEDMYGVKLPLLKAEFTFMLAHMRNLAKELDQEKLKNDILQQALVSYKTVAMQTVQAQNAAGMPCPLRFPGGPMPGFDGGPGGPPTTFFGFAPPPPPPQPSNAFGQQPPGASRGFS